MADVTRTNSKAFAELNARLDGLASQQVKIGWFESAKYPDGTQVALAAAVAETGSSKRSIPARPIFGPTIARQTSEWIALAAAGSAAVLRGEISAQKVFEQLGFKVQEDSKETIANIYSPPLSPVTLMARKYREDGRAVTGKTIGRFARKVNEADYKDSDLSNNTKPLIETKTMIRTLTNIVETIK